MRAHVNTFVSCVNADFVLMYVCVYQVAVIIDLNDKMGRGGGGGGGKSPKVLLSSCT